MVLLVRVAVHHGAMVNAMFAVKKHTETRHVQGTLDDVWSSCLDKRSRQNSREQPHPHIDFKTWKPTNDDHEVRLRVVRTVKYVLHEALDPERLRSRYVYKNVEDKVNDKKPEEKSKVERECQHGKRDSANNIGR